MAIEKREIVKRKRQKQKQYSKKRKKVDLALI
jgi:hypothetical protein